MYFVMLLDLSPKIATWKRVINRLFVRSKRNEWESNSRLVTIHILHMRTALLEATFTTKALSRYFVDFVEKSNTTWNIDIISLPHYFSGTSHTIVLFELTSIPLLFIRWLHISSGLHFLIYLCFIIQIHNWNCNVSLLYRYRHVVG